jgi:hypothetical protein
MPFHTRISIRQYKTLLRVKSRKSLHGRMTKPTYTMIAKKWRVPLSVILSAVSRGIIRYDKYIAVERRFSESRKIRNAESVAEHGFEGRT